MWYMKNLNYLFYGSKVRVSAPPEYNFNVKTVLKKI